MLTWATRNGAELLGMKDDLGTIEAGKLADLLVVNGDPSADISAAAESRESACRDEGRQVRRVRADAGEGHRQGGVRSTAAKTDRGGESPPDFYLALTASAAPFSSTGATSSRGKLSTVSRPGFLACRRLRVRESAAPPAYAGLKRSDRSLKRSTRGRSASTRTQAVPHRCDPVVELPPQSLIRSAFSASCSCRQP